MIVVIQCASGKRADAGTLIDTLGRPVRFVADPLAATAGAGEVYARPDDLGTDGKTWREHLLAYNRTDKRVNRLGLCAAGDLYTPPVYVHFKAAEPPRIARVQLERYRTSQRTNWHYAAARALLDDQS